MASVKLRFVAAKASRTLCHGEAFGSGSGNLGNKLMFSMPLKKSLAKSLATQIYGPLPDFINPYPPSFRDKRKERTDHRNQENEG
jgi:hypothetical protein